MKIKTSDLCGPALDWAVAKCEESLDGKRTIIRNGNYVGRSVDTEKRLYDYDYWAPSRLWKQAGPIIERKVISIWFHSDYGCWCAADKAWMCADPESDAFLAMPEAYRGPTPLVAAMRCYVASKLGEEIDVPDELT